jgi:hypothetical protein
LYASFFLSFFLSFYSPSEAKIFEASLGGDGGGNVSQRSKKIENINKNNNIKIATFKTTTTITSKITTSKTKTKTTTPLKIITKSTITTEKLYLEKL